MGGNIGHLEISMMTKAASISLLSSRSVSGNWSQFLCRDRSSHYADTSPSHACRFLDLLPRSSHTTERLSQLVPRSSSTHMPATWVTHPSPPPFHSSTPLTDLIQTKTSGPTPTYSTPHAGSLDPMHRSSPTASEAGAAQESRSQIASCTSFLCA